MASAFLLIAGWQMNEVSPVVLLLLGFVAGIFFDRLVLWPLAVLIARLDGRLRSR